MGLSLTVNLGVSAAANQTATLNSTSNYAQTQHSTSSTGSAADYGEGDITTNKTIKVLIYNGAYSIDSCVNGIKTALVSANANYLVPGYNFTYATSTVISSATLSGYDLLAMPGGNSGYNYITSGSISSTAIKNFISSGNGYLGICAGAYSGSEVVDGYYTAWGLADVRCTHPNHEGLLNVNITTAGQELFGYGGTVTMVHYNGPAFYATDDMITFATYADNTINSKDMAAIIGDYYGLGRTVLSGPHPELNPQFPDIVAYLIVWAANVSSSTTPSTSVTMDQVGTAASSVKSHYETNKILPNYVTIGDQQVSMSSFLYLLTAGTVQANSGYSAAIPLVSVDAATNPSGSIKLGSILKSEFLSIAQNILSYVAANGRAPNYVTTSLGNMSFDNAVYMYSKIMNYYKTYSRLPNYVSMASAADNTPAPATVTMAQVGSAAVTVKNYYESNKVLPGSVTVGSQTVSMSSLLDLLTTATLQANSGSTADITLKTLDASSNPSGTIKSGSILKSELLSVAQSIKSYVTSNGKAPNYISTSLGNMSFDKLVYMYSKIMNFYKTNNRLPNYVSMS